MPTWGGTGGGGSGRVPRKSRGLVDSIATSISMISGTAIASVDHFSHAKSEHPFTGSASGLARAGVVRSWELQVIAGRGVPSTRREPGERPPR